MKVSLPPFLYEDFPRKLTALFFAVLIWLAVERQLHEFESFHGVPVTLRYDTNSVYIPSNQVPRVDITLRGARKRLQSIKTTDLRVTATVDAVPRGIYFSDVRILPDSVRTPLGTRVSEVVPDRVAVAVDRVVERRNVPVTLRYEGEPRDGLKVLRETISPSTIAVRGPSKLVDAIRTVETHRVSLENAAQDFQVDDLALDLVSPELHVHPDRVAVKVELGRQSGERLFADLPVRVLSPENSPLRLKGELPKVSVTLRGPKAILDTLDGASIHPFVDTLSIVDAGQYRRPVRVWVDGAAGVTADYVNPSAFDVELVGPEPEAPPEPRLPER